MKLKTTWKFCEEMKEIPDNTRRDLLRNLLKDEDASWGTSRSAEEMEKQLDYLMGCGDNPSVAPVNEEIKIGT
jgi:hypothetical protein